MGKGDKKTRKGKFFRNSYGVTRPRKNKKKELVKNAKMKEKRETLD